MVPPLDLFKTDIHVRQIQWRRKIDYKGGIFIDSCSALLNYFEIICFQGMCTRIWARLQSLSKVLGQMPQIHISYPKVIPPGPLFNVGLYIEHFVLA